MKKTLSRHIRLAACSAVSILAACGGGDSLETGLPTHTQATTTTASTFPNAVTTTVGTWEITVTDLGVLPGGSMSGARAINNLGIVVGLGTDSTYSLQRVVWDLGAGTVTAALPNLDPSGTAIPESVNDSKESAGTEALSSSLREGVYWDAFGSVFALPAYGGGSQVQITAHRINASGQIAGSSREGAPNYAVHPVVWSRNGAPLSLGFLGNGNGGEAFGINDIGHVVGGASNGSLERAFLWRGDKLEDLGAAGGSSATSRAIAVNNTGVVAGMSDAGTLAVVWRYDPANAGSTPALARLPLPSGLVLPAPAALNDGGDVVGTATLQTYNGTRAVLWRGGEAINLGTWPGGTRSKAYGINNQGQIVGEGDVDGSGLTHALLWTVVTAGSAAPSPSPSTGANSTPSVSLKSTTSTSIKLGAALQVRGTFTDPDNGPWTYVFSWGDGTTSTGQVDAAGTIAASHAFAATSPKGGYKVTLKVTDALGTTGTSNVLSAKVSR